MEPLRAVVIAYALERLLTGIGCRMLAQAHAIASGLACASSLVWERTARETVAVYRQVLAEGPQA